jgi:hypothetical protein
MSDPDVWPAVLLGAEHAGQGLIAVPPQREGLLLVGLEAAGALHAGQRVHGVAVGALCGNIVVGLGVGVGVWLDVVACVRV